MPNVGAGIVAGGTALGLLGAGDAGDAADEAEQLYQTQAQIAAQQQALAREQWDLWKEIYLPYEREALGAQQRLLPTQEEAAEVALRGDVMDRETYEQTVAPVLQRIIDDAMAGVEDRTNYVVGQAAADVATQFGVQREQTRREQERRGVRPGSGAYEAGTRGMGLTEAGARAREVNRAREEERRRKEEVDWRRRGTAYTAGAPLRTPRAPTISGVGGLTAAAGPTGLSAAGRTAGAAAAGYGGLAEAYGSAAGDVLGQAAQFAFDKWGATRFSEMFGGGSGAPSTAGVSAGGWGRWPTYTG